MFKQNRSSWITPVCAIALAFSIIGCEHTDSYKYQAIGTATGAAVGAGTGAIIGSQVGAPGAGIAIGSGIGAGAGYLIGRGLDEVSSKAERSSRE